ncbi:MAG: hypothetical protein SynsKO_28250 [Synoicihabitans sp.]
MMRFRIAALLLSMVAVALPSATALTISGFTSGANDRFTNDDAFILDGFDLSGVGRSSDGRWGTLISDNVFLSANHLHPAINSTLTFYATNDSGGASTSHTVTSGYQVTGTDLWVGTLGTSVSSSYVSYSFATTPIADSTDFNAWTYRNAVGAVFGRPSEGTPTLIDMVVGYNVVDAWVEDVELTGVTNDALLSLEGNANDIIYESLLQGGDSGAPLFVNNNGSLLLVGINWFVGDVTADAITYDTNGYTYVGNYTSALNATISASAVPEPSSFAGALGLSAMLFAASRRRRRGVNQ